MDNLGIASHNFAEQNKDLVIQMTRQFLDYAKSACLEAADMQGAEWRQTEPEAEPLEIHTTNDGFPIIPKFVMDRNLKKSE